MSSFKFFSLGGFLLRKKSEKCIAFLVPSLHCKLALFRVPYALRATFIPSLRFGTGCASPYNPCHCLKLKNSKLNHLLFSGIHYKKMPGFISQASVFHNSSEATQLCEYVSVVFPISFLSKISLVYSSCFCHP